MKNIFYLISLAFCYSCAGGKYTYNFDTGKQLDFGKGKWILNKSKSNSEIFDTELYYISRNCFKEILGDSLMEMNDLRSTQLVAPKIKFDLSTSEMKQLKEDTGCDYIINIQGKLNSDGAGTISFQNSNPYYNASNSTSVSISIYDLNTGIQISSSQAYGKATDESSHFDEGNGLPDFHSSANTLLLKALKKLIRQYKNNQL